MCLACITRKMMVPLNKTGKLRITKGVILRD